VLVVVSKLKEREWKGAEKVRQKYAKDGIIKLV